MNVKIVAVQVPNAPAGAGPALQSTPSGPAERPGVVNIRGKEYMTVALRVQKFREAHPDWELSTEIIKADENVVIMQARIYTKIGRVVTVIANNTSRCKPYINRLTELMWESEQ